MAPLSEQHSEKGCNSILDLVPSDERASLSIGSPFFSLRWSYLVVRDCDITDMGLGAARIS